MVNTHSYAPGTASTSPRTLTHTHRKSICESVAVRHWAGEYHWFPRTKGILYHYSLFSYLALHRFCCFTHFSATLALQKPYTKNYTHTYWSLMETYEKLTGNELFRFMGQLLIYSYREFKHIIGFRMTGILQPRNPLFNENKLLHIYEIVKILAHWLHYYAWHVIAPRWSYSANLLQEMATCWNCFWFPVHLCLGFKRPLVRNNTFFYWLSCWLSTVLLFFVHSFCC